MTTPPTPTMTTPPTLTMTTTTIMPTVAPPSKA